MSAYPPIMLGQPGQEVCPDRFTTTSTLLCPDCVKIMLQVSVNAVYVQFGQLPGPVKGGAIGNIVWGPEEAYLPMIASLARNFDAVRVRNLAAGKAGQVILTPIGSDR